MKAFLSMFLLFLTLISTIKAQPTQGLVAYYPFNGNTNDYSGYENNGTIQGGVAWTTDRFENLNSAALFDGIDGYVKVPNSPSLSSPSNGFTVASWILIDPNHNIVSSIVDKAPDLPPQGEYGQYNFTYEHVNGGQFKLLFNGNDPSSFGGFVNYPIPLNQWCFVACIWNGAIAKIYLNDFEIGTIDAIGIIEPDTNSVSIGLQRAGYLNNHFKGKIDDVRIYQRALSHQEILELYNGVSANEEFFDDFSYDNLGQAEEFAWDAIQNPDGSPPEGAYYDSTYISFINDPSTQGNKLMTVKSSTRRSFESMRCSRIETKEMKFWEGTYAARIRFRHNLNPLIYRDGNIQTFYTINSLQGSSLYSELDFEYLSFDIWAGNDHSSKLWMNSWAYYNNDNDLSKDIDSLSENLNNEWIVLILDASDGQTVKYYINNELIFIQDFSHYGNQLGLSIYPDERMKIAFANWIQTRGTRLINLINHSYEFFVDWVYHIKNESLTYSAIQDRVSEFRSQGINNLDNISTSPLLPKSTISDNSRNILPLDFSLQQNYPNPFNPTTTIKYQIPELRFVTLKVYDILGNEVLTLINEEKLAGSYEVSFDASNLASGIYFYQLQAGNFTQTKKMILLK